MNNKLFFVSVYLFSSMAFSNESSYSCLKSLKETTNKFSNANSILLKCNEEEKACPFSVGDFEAESKSIAIPYNNKGTRGAMVYLEGSSKFVKFQTKGIKNNEKRNLKFISGGKTYCAEYSRTFGVSQDGLYRPIYNAVSNVSDYFNSSFIGYSFKYVEQAKCSNAELVEPIDISTNDTENLINGAIDREVKDTTQMTMQIDLQKDLIKAEWLPYGCINRKCAVKTKDKVQSLINNLNECLKNTKDSNLEKTIKESIEKISSKGKAIGMLPIEPNSTATSNNGAAATSK